MRRSATHPRLHTPECVNRQDAKVAKNVESGPFTPWVRARRQ